MNPNFFIIGAPKCGTSSLTRYLRGHPNTFLSRPKEPYYFASDFPRLSKNFPSLEAYLDLFQYAGPQHSAVGESSVWYLYSERAVPEILRFNPKAKFIAMVRNPSAMCRSLHAQHLFVLNEDERDFRKAWFLQFERSEGKSIPPSCVDPKLILYGPACRVGEQIERLYSIVDRDQVKIVLFDDFDANTREIYLSILQFLDLDDDGRTEFPVMNERKEYRHKWLQNLTLHEFRALKPMARWYKRAAGIQTLPWRYKLRVLNSKPIPRPSLSPDMQTELTSYFRDDVSKLEDLIGRKLSHWLS